MGYEHANFTINYTINKNEDKETSYESFLCLKSNNTIQFQTEF